MTAWQSGDRVKLTRAFVRSMRKSGSAEHVREFSGCYGYVVGLVDYGMGNIGPEIDVRWQPSNLRYAYHPTQLQRDKRKLRGKNRRK